MEQDYLEHHLEDYLEDYSGHHLEDCSGHHSENLLDEMSRPSYPPCDSLYRRDKKAMVVGRVDGVERAGSVLVDKRDLQDKGEDKTRHRRNYRQ